MEAGVDIVVVGQRYERLLAEDIFDLRLFQFPGVQRRERRSPPRPLEIHIATLERAVFLPLLPNRAGKPWRVRRGPADEIERLAGMKGVAVHGNTCPKPCVMISLLPVKMDLRVFQTASSVVEIGC
jgi:hypothetical protein